MRQKSASSELMAMYVAAFNRCMLRVLHPMTASCRVSRNAERGGWRINQLRALVTALLLVLPAFLGSASARAQDWPAIARELEAMLEADQAVRREWNALVAIEGRSTAETPPTQADAAQRAALRARVQAMDTAHQARLAAIIAAHGWPRRADVGGRATMAAFIIVQHAPVEFQRKVFADVQRAAASDEVDRSALAALEDRIRIHEKRPQRYGTQVEIRNGGVTLWPVEDPANLDARRRDVGLMPICSYLALFATPPAKVQYSACSVNPEDEPKNGAAAR